MELTNTEIDKISKTCPLCSATFVSSHVRRKYCSKECSKEARKLNVRLRSKIYFANRKKCRHCKKMFCYSEINGGCCRSEQCQGAERERKRQKAQKKYYNLNIKPQTKKHQKEELQKTERRKQKDRDSSKRYRQNNTEKVNIKARFLKQERQQWLIDYKKQCQCEACGESRWFCLDFHHTDPESKKIAINEMISRKYNLKRIQEEMGKCVLLCANCHRHLHFDCGNRPMPKQTEEWLDKNRKKEYA